MVLFESIFQLYNIKKNKKKTVCQMLVKIKILKAVDMLNYDESEEYIMNTADSIRSNDMKQTSTARLPALRQ